MSATVTRLPFTPAVGLREATGRFTGRDRFEPTTTAAPAPNDSVGCLKVRGLWSDQDSEEPGNSVCWAEGGQR